MNSEKNKSGFRFSDPQLVECIYLENGEYNKEYSSIGNIRFEISKTINKIIEIEKSNNHGSTVFLTVATDDKINFKEDIACYIRLTMKADFVWDKNEITDDEAKSFLNINAPALLLSYIRPKIHDLTRDAKITTQDIPFIDFTSVSNN